MLAVLKHHQHSGYNNEYVKAIVVDDQGHVSVYRTLILQQARTFYIDIETSVIDQLPDKVREMIKRDCFIQPVKLIEQ